jgi:hypothetical protein
MQETREDLSKEHDRLYQVSNRFTTLKFPFLDIWYWRRLKGDFTLPRGIEVFGIRGQYHIPSEVKLNSSYLTL